MEPGAIAELQELIQAQLVAKKAAQPNISNLLALQLRQRHAAQIRQLQRSLSPTSSSHSTGHESQYYGTRHDLQAGLLASKSIKPLSQSMGSLPSASSSSITSTSSSLASSPNPNNRLQPLSAWPKSEQSIKSQSQQNKKVHRTPYNIPDVFPESLASGEVDLTSVSSMNSYNSMSSAAKKKAGHGRMKKLFPPSHVEHVTAHLPDDMSTISRPASAELMQNVTDVFQDLVKRRTQVNQSRNSTSEFTSKLKLPRELGIAAKYEYHKSKQMMNALIDDVQNLAYSLKSNGNDSYDNAFVSSIEGTYKREFETFESVALYAQTRYIEIKEHEAVQNIQEPTKTKAVVIADLVLKLLRVMGRYNQVLEPLIWELLGCIFDEYAIHEKYFNPKNMIASMSELHTYFDLYHEASAQLDDVKDELEIIQQGHSMKRIVKRFQTVRLAFDEAACFIRDACFKTWHALTKHRKRLRHIGLWRGIRYRWKVWRDYVKDRTHREMEEYETELDRKIERLQELNHLITEHNADQIEQVAVRRQSLILFGSRDPEQVATGPSLVMQSNVPFSPMSAATPASAKLQHQKQTLNLMNKKLQRTLESGAIVNSPSSSASRTASVDFTNSPTNRRSFMIPNIQIPLNPMSIRASFAVASNVPFVAGENTADGLSPGSQFLEDEKTLNIIAQTAKLTNHLLADYKNVNTQTPDEWMVDAAENALMIFDAQYFQHKAKPVKAEEELKQTEETVVPVVATTTTTTDVETKVENFEELHKDLPRLQLVGEPIASKYVMDVNTANTLIMLIYESRMQHGKHNEDKMDFRKTDSLMEFSKHLLLSKYKLRRMSSKFYRELVACCVREGATHPRLELFGMLCGFPLPNLLNAKYDAAKCSFFFQILSVVFDRNVEKMKEAFLNFTVDRQIILESIPIIFEALFVAQHEQYQNLIFEVVDLPAIDASVASVTYLIHVDEVFSIFMEYYDMEISQRLIKEFVETFESTDEDGVDLEV